MFTTADSIHANASTILSIYRSNRTLISTRRTKISTSVILTAVAPSHSSADDSNSDETSLSRDDIYSPMSGIKTGATLSGMLIRIESMNSIIKVSKTSFVRLITDQSKSVFLSIKKPERDGEISIQSFFFSFRHVVSCDYCHSLEESKSSLSFLVLPSHPEESNDQLSASVCYIL